MILAEIINIVRSGSMRSRDLWLFIAGDADALALDTECELAEVLIDEDADYEEIVPVDFEQRGLSSTISLQTLEDCVEWADRLAGGPDPAVCCEVIRYYLRFDAFPERLGTPDPSPLEEIIAQRDREFFDALGEERSGPAKHRLNDSPFSRPSVQTSAGTQNGRPSPMTVSLSMIVSA